MYFFMACEIAFKIEGLGTVFAFVQVLLIFIVKHLIMKDEGFLSFELLPTSQTLE